MFSPRSGSSDPSCLMAQKPKRNRDSVVTHSIDTVKIVSFKNILKKMGEGHLGRCLDHDGGACVNGLKTLIKTPFEDPDAGKD